MLRHPLPYSNKLYFITDEIVTTPYNIMFLLAITTISPLHFPRHFLRHFLRLDTESWALCAGESTGRSTLPARCRGGDVANKRY